MNEQADIAAMKSSPAAGSEDASMWARFEKKRTFVRALEGTYSDLTADLLSAPRVVPSRSVPWHGGPSLYGKHAIAPGAAAKISQAVECHLLAIAPGSCSQKHGHMNSACFYILRGRGYDIHDGRRIDWAAGDIVFVENGCVHQHFNNDPDNEAVLLVFKAKPLFLFMHLLYQKMIVRAPRTLPVGSGDWKAPTDL